MGLAAGIVCSFAVGLKFRLGYDDSLDVVGVHFVGGLVGVLLIGLLATEVMTAGAPGLFYGGGLAQLGKQALAALVVAHIRVHRVLRGGQVDRPRHGLSGQRRRRNDRSRLHPARRDRVRRGSARASASRAAPIRSANPAPWDYDPSPPKKADGQSQRNLNRPARVVVDPSRV